MTETNTVAGIEVKVLTSTSVYVPATSAPTVASFVIAPRHGIRGGLLALATAATFMSSPSVESDLGALTQLRLRSPQATESRLLPDEEGAEARELRRAALYRLRAAQFPPEGREQRITNALAALHASNPLSGVDRAIWKWAAEDIDLEEV
jgi:hypothetical protein